MTLSKNTFRGYLGSTRTTGGVSRLYEVNQVTPTVLSTSISSNSTSITLPSGIENGQTIIIFAGSQSNINTPSGYTLINREQTLGNPKIATFYKIANGTEGGTSLTVISDQSVLGCAVLDFGIPDVEGTPVLSGTDQVTVAAILPRNASLVFLFSLCNSNSGNPTLNTGGSGFTTLIDNADNGGVAVRELFVWSKISDGTEVDPVQVDWAGSNNVAAVMFSMTL
jgi:hypothetical protein